MKGVCNDKRGTKNELGECVKVIFESFKTVADELGFTAVNAPRFTEFVITEEMRKAIEHEDEWQAAVRVENGEMV